MNPDYQYKVVECASIKEFEKECTALSENGWIIHGLPMAYVFCGNRYFAQVFYNMSWGVSVDVSTEN